MLAGLYHNKDCVNILAEGKDRMDSIVVTVVGVEEEELLDRGCKETWS
jgi:hypothetical protein